jgi:transposase-like protein
MKEISEIKHQYRKRKCRNNGAERNGMKAIRRKARRISNISMAKSRNNIIISVSSISMAYLYRNGVMAIMANGVKAA